MNNMVNMVNMKILNNVNDLHLFWNILDFVVGNPSKHYKNVLEELKFNFKTRCNINCSFKCLFMDDELIILPLLARAVHAQCNICGNSISDYSHRFCNLCAVKGTTEYNYHHRNCVGFIEENYQITNPI
jgi:hypothetical protein